MTLVEQRDLLGEAKKLITLGKQNECSAQLCDALELLEECAELGASTRWGREARDAIPSIEALIESTTTRVNYIHEPPTCPVHCDKEMELRSSKHSGAEFWGCQLFPQCTRTRDVSIPDAVPVQQAKEPMELNLPHTAMVVRRVYVRDKQEIENEISEGEVPMTQQQQDQYKLVIGDGLARIAVGRDLSDTDYGSGGKAFVSVSLACDQSAAGISSAIVLAQQMADYYVEQHIQAVRQKCYQLNLLKPPADPNARPQY